MRPSLVVIDSFLPNHTIDHFLTTPAARLVNAVAVLRKTPRGGSRLKEALADLHWIDAKPQDFLRAGVLMAGSAMATAARAYLVRLRGGQIDRAEIDLLQHVLDDAKSLLRLNGGDGLRASSSVATPGGITETLHNAIFATKWPPGS